MVGSLASPNYVYYCLDIPAGAVVVFARMPAVRCAEQDAFPSPEVSRKEAKGLQSFIALSNCCIMRGEKMFGRRVFVLLVVLVFSGLSQAVPTNGDFSDGLNGWDYSDHVSAVDVAEGDTFNTKANFEEFPTSGMISWLTQTFFIPEGAQNLFFDYQMLGGLPGTDKFTVYLNGDKIFYVDSDYFPSTVETVQTDVSLFAGQPDPVTLRFELLTDAENEKTTNVYLDNVNVPTIIVPVPSAGLLGCIGVGSIAWLRRRRTL